MCGRYRLTKNGIEFEDHFDAEIGVPLPQRWNIAPTDKVGTIRQDRHEPKRMLGLMRWGLIPYWAKDISVGARAINAMSETAAEKPAFREAMRRRRCLVPADGFYEWKKLSAKEKQPYSFGMADDSLFAFAGLWERWRNPENQMIESFTILTTRANALLADVHDRMPVILRPEDYDLWLDPGVTDAARVADLLQPFDPRMMRLYPVSTRVNRVGNDDPECAREIDLQRTATPTLF